MLLQRIANNDLLDARRDARLFQQQLNRLFSLASAASESSEFPLINVWTSGNDAVARAEIPGVEPKDIEITIVNDTLTIRGSRNPDAVKDGETCHRQERGYGQFSRSMQLPFGVESEAVKARFSNGVLTIELPREESKKARRIDVINE
jgi:HSP20 family protein